MKIQGIKKPDISKIKSHKSFAALWLKFFITGDVIASLGLILVYWCLYSPIMVNYSAIRNINYFFEKLMDSVMTPGDTYLGMLSLVFIVTSLVSVLSGKSETIYWLSVMDYKLVNPHYFNLVSISAFLASCVLLATVSFAFLPEYIYICLIVVIVLLFSLSMKMLSGFFYKEKSMELLKQKFIIGNILANINKEINAYFKAMSSGFNDTEEIHLNFLLTKASSQGELLSKWVFFYNLLGQTNNKNTVKDLLKCNELNKLAELIHILGLHDYNNSVANMVLIKDMPENFVDSIDYLVDNNIVSDKDELFEQIKDKKEYIEWASERKKLVADKTIYLYKIKLLQSRISENSIDFLFRDILKIELPILGIKPDESASLDDLISSFTSIPEYNYVKDEIDRLNKLIKSYPVYCFGNADLFIENREDLVSMTMSYIDNLDLERLRENLNLLIYTKREEESLQIMSRLSEVNPEIFASLILGIKNKKFLKSHSKIYEPMLYRLVTEKTYINVVLRFVEKLYLAEAKEYSHNYENMTDRYYISPEYRIPSYFRSELEKINTKLYESILPINEILLKAALAGNYSALTFLLKLICDNEPSIDAVNSNMYSNICIYLGYSEWATALNINFDAKLKIWSYILPEYYEKIQNILTSALSEGAITEYEYDNIENLFYSFRKRKYIVLYQSTMLEEYDEHINAGTINKYVDENKDTTLVKEALNRISDVNIVPGCHHLDKEDMAIFQKKPN